MKRVLLFAALAVFGLSTGFAQDGDDSGSNDDFTIGFQKGDWYVSGALSYSSTTTDDVKDNSLIIMPAAGYLVDENIAVGLTAGYMSFQGENGSMDTRDETVVQIAAYGKYIFNAQKRFNQFVGLGLGYETRDFGLESQNFKENGFGVQGFGGVGFWFADCFGIFTQVTWLSYSSVKPDFDDAESTNNFAIGADLKEVAFGAIVKF